MSVDEICCVSGGDYLQMRRHYHLDWPPEVQTLSAFLARPILPAQHWVMLLTVFMSPSLTTRSRSALCSVHKYVMSLGVANGQAVLIKYKKSSSEIEVSGELLELQLSPKEHFFKRKARHVMINAGFSPGGSAAASPGGKGSWLSRRRFHWFWSDFHRL